jgi:hypothetical protein
MAQWAVQERAVSIRVACQVFGISQTTYKNQLTVQPSYRQDIPIKIH